MSEENMGIEPEVRLFFKKIMKTVGVLLVWTMTMATIGLFMKWAYVINSVRWQNIVFYILFLFSFILLIRFFFQLWAKKV